MDQSRTGLHHLADVACLQFRAVHSGGVPAVARHSTMAHTVTAYTDYGCLTVNGSKLHVEELNLDTGLLEITGEVTALVYSSKTEKSQSFLRRMFS